MEEEKKPVEKEEVQIRSVKQYVCTEEAAKHERLPEDKQVISNDAFAIIDFIDQLNRKLEHLRISSIMRK